MAELQFQKSFLTSILVGDLLEVVVQQLSKELQVNTTNLNNEKHPIVKHTAGNL